ncbi:MULTISPECIES: cbb3-type cytochrome c oxidase subunit 3 [unclassified Shewanella]|uniref:cbb3-type cytochrome oxidase subunit 3 n=1 Tax=unclassified Shewanella TaxID=196818 RepID=UPI000C81AF46|nr:MULTISPECIES: cbb3-type cytochrome c oxidase subunit 3 [unclassified Shewanella]MDO6618285.1 cbb3-type cytochrome c oxidase subunit 3 [Shewanella sp. 6_MG-2023]MDO6641603.1 cbb3-type cytochrome c oxidase subunit 3 [Shewanella sp. 5_MG-2023]MDO6679945.1 cbb3-type cytochrome c oxidase subunit 3 [Shewanella sp. 4_MG-2023]MDO6775693.1 cbb3-type cytochrome c oxidase subunit 3 [Shewanella sp. 3_MG-2023]PMG39903.1 cytochrome oxidase [Shewanella sp. 10N.286.52.B9]
MDYGTLQGILTIIVMVVFAGIFYWAYSSKSKAKFDEAANLIFSEEEIATRANNSGDNK